MHACMRAAQGPFVLCTHIHSCTIPFHSISNMASFTLASSTFLAVRSAAAPRPQARVQRRSVVVRAEKPPFVAARLATQRAGEQAKDAANDAGDAIKGAAGDVKSAAGDAADKAKSAGKDIGNSVNDASSDAQNEAGKAASKTQGAVDDAADSAKGGAKDAKKEADKNL